MRLPLHLASASERQYAVARPAKCDERAHLGKLCSNSGPGLRAARLFTHVYPHSEATHLIRLRLAPQKQRQQWLPFKWTFLLLLCLRAHVMAEARVRVAGPFESPLLVAAEHQRKHGYCLWRTSSHRWKNVDLAGNGCRSIERPQRTPSSP